MIVSWLHEQLRTHGFHEKSSTDILRTSKGVTTVKDIDAIIGKTAVSQYKHAICILFLQIRSESLLSKINTTDAVA